MKRIEFGADGIRGCADTPPFTLAHSVRMGYALGQFMIARYSHPVAVIGRDTRPSGLSLATCVSAGLTSMGVDVINLGVMTTPGIAFITRRQSADLGIIISASHSPYEMNGIKIVDRNGLRLRREQEIDIEILINDAIKTPPSSYPEEAGHEGEGKNLHQYYIREHIYDKPGDLLFGLKLLLDCADGAASIFAPEVLSRLGADIQVIHDEIDSGVINLECGSEYARNHPAAIAEILHQTHSMYCFSYDGDGDRLIVVDREGNVFSGYDLMYLFSIDFKLSGTLRKDTLVTTHYSNRGLEKALQSFGICTKYTNNGDRNLEEELWGNDYLLAGEEGGNIIVNDGIHTSSDAIHTSILLGKILVNDNQRPLIERVQPLRQELDNHPQTIRSVRIPNGITMEQQKSIQKEIRRRESLLGKGSRVRYWSSSTEPGLYRFLVEGNRSSMLEEVEKTAAYLTDFLHNFTSTGQRNRNHDDLNGSEQ
jgi:phosphoglucosamine mutase